MVWIRCCPRCKGDLQDNRDIYGFYLTDSEEARLRHSTGHRSPVGSIDSAKKAKTALVGAPWGGTE